MADLSRMLERAEERAKGPGEKRVSNLNARAGMRLDADEDDRRAQQATGWERRVRKGWDELIEETRSEVVEAVEEIGHMPRVSEDYAHEQFEEIRDSKISEGKSLIAEGLESLTKLRDSYAEDLPDFRESRNVQKEREVRDRIHAMDPEEQGEALNEIAENGTDIERRAVLDSDFRPRMAGLRGSEDRANVRERALKNAAPDAFKSVTSIDKAIEKLGQEYNRFRQKVSEITVGHPYST